MLKAWPTSLWLAISGAFGAAVAVIAIACWFGLSRIDRARRRWTSLLGAVAVLGSALFGVLLVRELVLPDAPLAEGELDHTGQELRVPPVDSRLSVFLHSELPPVDPGQAEVVRLTVAVRDEQHALLRRTAVFERGAPSGRAWRSTTIITDSRIDLPVETRRRSVTIQVEQIDGPLRGPVSAQLAPGPPSRRWLAGAGGVLLLMAWVSDGVERLRTRFGVAVGFIVAEALLLLSALHPDAPASAILKPTLLAAVMAMPTTWLLRRLLGYALGRLDERAPARPQPTSRTT